MSTASTIARNIASNWLGFAVNAVVTLALTPFILQQLGPSRYGVWILTSSIIGYYGFLDFGLRAGVTQYLTRYIALGEYDKAGECLSSALAVLASLGAVISVLSVAAALAAPHLFNLPGDLANEAFWCILIVGCTMAVHFVFTPFMSIFMAVQRFDLGNAIGIGTRLLSAAAIVFVLRAGYGLVGVSAATCVTSLIDFIIRWRVSRRLAPLVVVSPRLVRRARLSEVWSFGAWSFLISVNTYFYQYVPNMLIGGFLPVAAVGHYALAVGLVRQLSSILSPIGQVIYPTATRMHSQGNDAGLRRLYYDGSRLMLSVMFAAVLIAGFWAEDFYRLWIGERYLTGGHFQSVATLFHVLLLSIVTSYFSNIGAQILSGAGYVRYVATILIIGSAINLSGSLLLIGPYGLLGVALATLFASLVIDVVVIPVAVQRLMGLSVWDFWRRACVRPLLVGTAQAAIMYGIRLTGTAHTWLQLVGQLALAGASAGTLVILGGMTSAERQRFLRWPNGSNRQRVVDVAS